MMFRWFALLLVMLLSPLSWAGELVNLNTADVALLDTLPGIGPAKAQAIVDFRSQNGPFAHPGDVVNVSGIGPATWANIQALVTVDGAAPAAAPADEPAPAPAPAPDPAPAPVSGPSTGGVNINTASASELESLPGIGATKASAIVADREANGPFSSCEDLTRVTGVGPATVANIAGNCTTK